MKYLFALAIVLTGCSTTKYVEVPAPYPVEVSVPIFVPDTTHYALMRAYVEYDASRFDPVVIDSTGVRIVASGTSHDKALVLAGEILYLHTTLKDILEWFRITLEE